MHFQNKLDGVSRETMEKIDQFVGQIILWNKKINLISKNDEAVIYEKHIIPCVELYNVIKNETDDIVDMGSGGGLPGVVLSILSSQSSSSRCVTMIDSDQRKCVFLEEVSRYLDLKTNVINARIETTHEIKAKVLTARALTSVENLLNYSKNILEQDGTGYFLKGKQHKEELLQAQQKVKFESEIIPLTGESVVIKVQRIKYDC
jgi:16S rRNA (guanine527-N7)-methyltransferase